MEKVDFSFVIPCYCSDALVGDVLNEITAVLREKNEYQYEIIAVNDASPDQVLDVLKERAKN